MENLQLILDAILLEIPPNTNTLYADDIINPLYDRLMSLIQQRLRDEPDKQAMLNNYLEDPSVWEDNLAQALVQANVADDDEIVGTARELVQIVKQIDAEDEVADHPDALKPPSSIPGILEDFDEET